MIIINDIKEMQSLANSFILEGKKISFIPTMGALHNGHLELVKAGAQHGDITVVSIFVNPAQFGPNEDYNKYPRNLETDMKMLEDLGVDVIFSPSLADMYPAGFETYVELEKLPNHLCGLTRKGHFRGVATVVLKLFNIVKPHFAVFGLKDYQQLRIIQKMVNDLALEVEIISHHIVREQDGLAMSSRNNYLAESEKTSALALSKSLFAIKKEFDDGTSDAQKLINLGIETLNNSGLDEIEYLEICDPLTLDKKSIAAKGDLVAMALKIKSTRLIDNLLL